MLLREGRLEIVVKVVRVQTWSLRMGVTEVALRVPLLTPGNSW